MLVIGVGNEYRQDDGAGIAATRQLRPILPEFVRVIELSGEGSSLMEAWAGEDTVWIIDAVSSGAPVGAIHVIDASNQIVSAGFFHYSSHAFGVAEAIELSRAMGALPTVLMVYGIEGYRYGDGPEFSKEVEDSIREVASQVYRDIVNRIGATLPTHVDVSQAGDTIVT